MDFVHENIALSYAAATSGLLEVFDVEAEKV
jgi:hypothetical protein